MNRELGTVLESNPYFEVFQDQISNLSFQETCDTLATTSHHRQSLQEKDQKSEVRFPCKRCYHTSRVLKSAEELKSIFDAEMIVYRDIISEDEVLSDAFKLSPVKDKEGAVVRKDCCSSC